MTENLDDCRLFIASNVIDRRHTITEVNNKCLSENRVSLFIYSFIYLLMVLFFFVKLWFYIRNFALLFLTLLYNTESNFEHKEGVLSNNRVSYVQ